MKLLILAVMLISCESNLQCVNGKMYDCVRSKDNACSEVYNWEGAVVKCTKRVKK